VTRPIVPVLDGKAVPLAEAVDPHCCTESRVKLRPVGSDRVAVAALTGPTSLDLLGDPARPATVTNCYRVHREAAANWEVVEATDAQLAQLHAAGYTGLRDARPESHPLSAS
jgi:hypothetical protein